MQQGIGQRFNQRARGGLRTYQGLHMRIFAIARFGEPYGEAPASQQSGSAEPEIRTIREAVRRVPAMRWMPKASWRW